MDAALRVGGRRGRGPACLRARWPARSRWSPAPPPGSGWRWPAGWPSGGAVAGLARGADRLTAALAGFGGLAVPADVTDLAAVRAAVQRVTDELGPVDLLVNNAGLIDAAEVPVWEADPEQWWSVVESQLRGPFHLVQAVVPAMVARGGGRVVDLASGMSTRAEPGLQRVLRGQGRPAADHRVPGRGRACWPSTSPPGWWTPR